MNDIRCVLGFCLELDEWLSLIVTMGLFLLAGVLLGLLSLRVIARRHDSEDKQIEALKISELTPTDILILRIPNQRVSKEMRDRIIDIVREQAGIPNKVLVLDGQMEVQIMRPTQGEQK